MKEDKYKWVALSCTTIGALFSVLSGSTLMIALPVIMKDLNAGMGVVTWILMGYMLAMTILVPAIGRISDMVGRKKLYVSGFAIFTFTSLLCAISRTGDEEVKDRPAGTSPLLSPPRRGTPNATLSVP